MESREIFKQVEVIRDSAPISRLSCVDAIRERKGDVRCFNPGLLVTRGWMPVDPVREFATRFSASPDMQPFCVALPPNARPFFRGIGVSNIAGDIVDWDRRLYGISAARAKECFDFLGGIGLKGPEFFASSVQQEIDIPDPTKPTFANKPIHVYVFGVLIENAITYIEPNGYDTPYVNITAAAPHLALSSRFKINPLTAEQFHKLRGE